MFMFFSKSTNGFYHPDIHAVIPEDAVAVSEDEYKMLIASGKQIVATSAGTPVLSDKPAPFPMTREAAAKMLSSSVSQILKGVATAKHYASMEEACSVMDGPYAADGQLFRQLRDATRGEMLNLISKLQDDQDLSEVRALLQGLRDFVKVKRAAFDTTGAAND